MKKPLWFDTSIETFVDGPALADHGILKATLMSLWGFLATNSDGTYDYSHIDMDTVRRVANHPTWWETRKNDMLVLDLEVLDVNHPDWPYRDHIHDQLIEACQIYREAHPNIAIGYYGEIPRLAFYEPLYWKNQHTGQWDQYKEAYAKWHKVNRQALTNLDDDTLKITQKGLCAVVDRVFPSCYHPEQSVLPMPQSLQWWKDSHDGNIEESLRYQKPIIAYLCPQYNGSGPYFETGVWKEMLSHSLHHPYVDGVCVYQAVPAGTKFDANADWWKETLEVVGGH